MHWDKEVYFQSRHLSDYEACLDKLAQDQLTYRCVCSRKTLADLTTDGIYPGICRDKVITAEIPHAIRIRTQDSTIAFNDNLQGEVISNLAKQHGDFILKRKDGIIAYQLAVVIDDHLQKVNHVVRGCDLLAETPKQLYLQQLLGLTLPKYLHMPVIVDSQGKKLSKQTLAKAVDIENPSRTMFELLKLLKQNPPDELKGAPVKVLVDWAINNWQPELLRLCSTIGL